jgi:hypothetical protein
MHAKRRAVGLIVGMIATGTIAAAATAAVSVPLSATTNYAPVKSASSVRVPTTPDVTPFNYFDM